MLVMRRVGTDLALPLFEPLERFSVQGFACPTQMKLIIADGDDFVLLGEGGEHPPIYLKAYRI